MLIYRYEREDGGGPFCTIEGRMRNDLDAKIVDDGFKYGCISKRQLDIFFSGQEQIIKNCYLKIYDIPEEEIVFLHNEVKFPKHYSPIN